MVSKRKTWGFLFFEAEFNSTDLAGLELAMSSRLASKSTGIRPPLRPECCTPLVSHHARAVLIKDLRDSQV